MKFSKPIKLAVPAFALLTLFGLYAAINTINQSKTNNSLRLPESEMPVYQTKTKFRYDEMAHKLVIEYGSQTCGQLNKKIASGFGNALHNVSRHIIRRPVVIQL